jgi:Tol biopolymer transport system component
MKRFIVCIILLQSLFFCLVFAQAPKGVAVEITPDEAKALAALKTKIDGQIIWSSSRMGKHKIFMMNCDGSDIKAVTKGNKTDWYPRFSPDGTRIIFCRSKMDWTSEMNANNSEMWDTWIIDSMDAEERLLIPNSTWATWYNNGKTILFSRGTKVFSYNFGSGEEKNICNSETDMGGAAILQTPHISSDGKYIAMTLRGKMRETGIYDLEHKSWEKVNDGCQINWFPSGDKVYLVHPTGNGGSQVLVQAVRNGKLIDPQIPFDSTIFIDLPGRRSHEYFPQVSADGKWLVWAATQRGHDHDIADYEIYIWKIDSPKENAVRLTFHSGNDRWPDIFIMH